MSDIRNEISDDRGIIKKIQLLLPGYRGYRINEDLRDADIFLKDALYKKMLEVISELKNGQASLISNGVFSGLEVIGTTRSRIQTASALVRHHDLGYSGVSAPIRADAKKISAIYDLDSKISEEIKRLDSAMKEFVNECNSGKLNTELLQQVNSVVASILDLNKSRANLLYGGV
ncbi:MAG: hypothetical protein ACP5NK_07860 [Thermoplasmata archaeon]